MQSSKAATLDLLSDLATGIRSAKREAAVILRCLADNVSISSLDIAKVFRGLDDQIANITNEILQEESDNCEGGDDVFSYSSSKSSFTPNSSSPDFSQSSLRSLNDNEGIYFHCNIQYFFNSSLLFCLLYLLQEELVWLCSLLTRIL